MPTTTLDKPAIQDTILVFEKNSKVHHCFCSLAEAQERLRETEATHSGGAMFTVEGISADIIYSIAPNVRDRIDEAKSKLQREILIRDALDRIAVPRDRELRKGIYKAFADVIHI